MYTRLYYARAGGGQLANGAKIDPAKSALDAGEKIGKLIPVELVTAYGALVSVMASIGNPTIRSIVIVVVFLACWVLTPMYLRKVSDPKLPRRNHLIVSTLAFPVWAYLVSGSQFVPQIYDPALATIAATLFSLISGAIPMDR